MDSRPQFTLRLVRRLLALLVVAGAVVLAPPIALGECDGPFPSFEHAAPSARRIVIGQVVATLPGAEAFEDGRTSQFVLRGWSVLEDDRAVRSTSGTYRPSPVADSSWPARGIESRSLLRGTTSHQSRS
jgi:hypothetical protein